MSRETLDGGACTTCGKFVATGALHRCDSLRITIGRPPTPGVPGLQAIAAKRGLLVAPPVSPVGSDTMYLCIFDPANPTAVRVLSLPPIVTADEIRAAVAEVVGNWNDK